MARVANEAREAKRNRVRLLKQARETCREENRTFLEKELRETASCGKAQVRFEYESPSSEIWERIRDFQAYCLENGLGFDEAYSTKMVELDDGMGYAGHQERMVVVVVITIPE